MTEMLTRTAAEERIASSHSLAKPCGVVSCHPHFGELLQGALAVEKGADRRTGRALVSVHMPHADGAEFRATLEPSRVGLTSAAPAFE